MSLFFISCKKSDDNNTPSSKTKTQLLTQMPWKNSVVLKRSTPSDSWTSANTPPCTFDDITTFTASTYSVDNGATVCNPGEPQIVETGTWNFTSNETHLSYNRNFGSGGTQILDWTIEQLGEDIFEFTYYFPAGPYYKITMTH
jgi:hypothetical protein